MVGPQPQAWRHHPQGKAAHGGLGREFPFKLAKEGGERKVAHLGFYAARFEFGQVEKRP